MEEKITKANPLIRVLRRNEETVAVYRQSDIDANRETWRDIASTCDPEERDNANDLAHGPDDDLVDDLLARNWLDVKPGIYQIFWSDVDAQCEKYAYEFQEGASA